MLGIVIIALILGWTEALNPYPVTMSTGVYFEKLKNVHIYQKTAPILYTSTINLSDDRENLKAFVKAANAHQLKYNTSKQIIKNIHDLIRLTQITYNSTINLIADFRYENATPRPKQGLRVLGEALKWCCTTLIEADGNKLLANEKSLRKNYEELKDALIDDHKNILSISNELKISTKNIQKLMDSLDSRLYEIYSNVNFKISEIEQNQETYEFFMLVSTLLFNYIGEHEKISTILGSCKNYQLPSNLISQEMLKIDLLKLENAALKIGQELTISSNQIHKYYRLKLLNCHIIGNQLELELKVPLKSKDTEFQLYEYTPIKFRSHGSRLCEWSQSMATLIFEVHSQSVFTLMGKDLQDCNPQTHLCKVPQTRTSDQAPQCAKSLFLEKQLGEILKTCIFQCEPNHGEPIVKQIGPEKFALTNAFSNLSLYDIVTKTLTPLQLNTSLPGTLLITLGCTYELHQSLSSNVTQLIIPSGFPCLKSSKKPVEIVHHLPILWTEMAVNDVGYRMDSETAALGVRWKEYNVNWTSVVPHFSPISSNHDFAKRLHNVEIKMLNFDKNETINAIHAFLIIWNTLITLAFVVIIFLVIRSYAFEPLITTQKHLETLFETKLQESLNSHAESIPLNEYSHSE